MGTDQGGLSIADLRLSIEREKNDLRSGPYFCFSLRREFASGEVLKEFVGEVGDFALGVAVEVDHSPVCAVDEINAPRGIDNGCEPNGPT